MRKSTLLGVAVSIMSACLVATAPAGAGEAERATKRFEVTAKVSNPEPTLGDKFTIRGEVKPARPGQVVKLQLRFGTSGKWQTTKTDVLNAKSKYKFVAEAISVRFRQYRVVKPAQGATKSGKSAKLGVTVYGWRDLTSLSPVATNGTGETGSVTINATAYEQSIVGNSYANSGSIAYNINRGCKRFEGRVGLSDSSALTATGEVKILGDTTGLYASSFGLTQSAAVGLDLTGVFRITVDWASTNTAGTPENQSGAIIAVGSPRLLCNF